AEDERETKGRRALLNLGHTFGHALEAEAGFSGRLLHGEAVAAGIVLAFDFSVERGLCRAEESGRVRDHLSAAGLPTNLKAAGVRAEGAGLVRHMTSDKKMESGRLPFVLVRGIGRAFLDRDVDLGEVASFLDRHD
ncbi:MAG: 3-dehydroquinate synthase, partial [Allosphingosinicella sp.]